MSNNQKGRDKVQLSGTTLRIYRYLYKSGRPLGIREIQRGLSLSSPSVAEYHVRKLLAMGLVKQEEKRGKTEGSSESSVGFVVDRIAFENMIRVKKILIPIQAAFVVFFGLALVLLVFLFRPSVISGLYLFSIVIAATAFGVFVFQTVNAFRGSGV